MTTVFSPVTKENTFATALFERLPNRYDALAEVLSFAQNARWRSLLVDRVCIEDPRQILDVATGTGAVAIALAQRMPAQIVGVDISDSMLNRGRRRVADLRLESQVRLQMGRAEALPFETASFDAVSFTYLLRYVREPVATLSEMARVLRSGGVLAGFDFSVPSVPIWRLVWSAYTRLGLPVAGGVLGGRPWLEAGRFLGPSISRHHRLWSPAALQLAWESAGMVEVESKAMTLGAGLLMWGRKSRA